MIIYVIIAFVAILIGMAISVSAFGTGGKRKKIFQDIYFSVEDVDGIGVLYTKTGEYSAILKMENPVQKYSANIDSYYEFNHLVTALAQTLGEGYAIHKQDVFVRKQFQDESNDNHEFLSESYFKYFNGRSYTDSQTYLIITQENKKSRIFSFDSKKWRDFVVKIRKVKDQLKDSGVEASYLDGNTAREYVDRYFSMNFNDKVVSMTNFKVDEESIVGNPPYQIMDGGGTGSSATPIYNKFVDLAKLLNPNNVSMIIPAKWYTGGKGLDEFRANMLNDKQLIKLFDYEDSRDCFPTVDIAGGVCYFLWNKGSDNKCVVTSILGSFRNESTRYLNEHDTFIRNQKVLDIINKVKSQTFTGFLSQTVYVSKPFGIRSFQRGFPAKPGRNISLFGSDGITYMEEKDVPQNKEIVDKWKVIMSKASAEHAGQTDANGRKRIVSRLEVLPPYTICTESYLLLDIFDNEEEAQNLKKYIRTCFTRFLLASILITQNIVRDKFKFVPIQNYKNNSDIDWSQSIPDIDRQLYTKYNLSDDEIAFIEKMIKPMD